MITPQTEAALKEVAHCLVNGGAVRIRYRAADGEVTERTIVPKSQDGMEVRAFCLKRGEYRTFRLDRIQGLAAHPPAKVRSADKIIERMELF